MTGKTTDALPIDNQDRGKTTAATKHIVVIDGHPDVQSVLLCRGLAAA